MTTRAVPLFGVTYKDSRLFDPRHPALRDALAQAGLDVRTNDAVFVYVAGWSWDIDDGLERAGLTGRVRLTVVGCARCRSLTRAAN